MHEKGCWSQPVYIYTDPNNLSHACSNPKLLSIIISTIILRACNRATHAILNLEQYIYYYYVILLLNLTCIVGIGPPFSSNPRFHECYYRLPDRPIGGVRGWCAVVVLRIELHAVVCTCIYVHGFCTMSPKS